MKIRVADPQTPETRVGNCCGCSRYPIQLHKVPGNLYRYRCARCFKSEVGYFPHTATPAEIAQANCTCAHSWNGEHAAWCAAAPMGGA